MYATPPVQEGYSDDNLPFLRRVQEGYSDDKVPFLRTAYNYDRNRAGDESGLDCRYDPVTGEETPSMTQQQFAEECDINTIVKRFGLDYKPEGIRAPQYGDFTGINSFQQAVNQIALANEAFDELHAEVRARFNNNPGEFVDFALKEENREQLEKWGMVNPKPAPKPTETALEPKKETPPATPPKGE